MISSAMLNWLTYYTAAAAAEPRQKQMSCVVGQPCYLGGVASGWLLPCLFLVGDEGETKTCGTFWPCAHKISIPQR